MPITNHRTQAYSSTLTRTSYFTQSFNSHAILHKALKIKKAVPTFWQQLFYTSKIEKGKKIVVIFLISFSFLQRPFFKNNPCIKFNQNAYFLIAIQTNKT